VNSRGVLVAIFAAIFVLSVAGCVTTDGSNSGWVVVDQPSSSPPPTTKKHQPPPPPRHKENRGQQVAAQNHLQSAYRFLQKDKPDHALRELEKARKKMRPNFWFHYYYGGAYYLKGMFGEARDSWERAYRNTQNYTLRSRIRTCQSFAIYNLDGHGPSIGVLEKAIKMDTRNRTARLLFQDLSGSDSYRSYDQPVNKKSSSSPYVQEKLGQRGGAEDDNMTYRNDRDEGESKYGNGDKKKDEKTDKKKGKRKGKKKEMKYKIQDDEMFRVYFMVEMP
jgi:tetratricopeptide (TPR) repeat protein